jgi:hypothetical protein
MPSDSVLSPSLYAICVRTARLGGHGKQYDERDHGVERLKLGLISAFLYSAYRGCAAVQQV